MQPGEIAGRPYLGRAARISTKHLGRSEAFFRRGCGRGRAGAPGLAPEAWGMRRRAPQDSHSAGACAASVVDRWCASRWLGVDCRMGMGEDEMDGMTAGSMTKS